MRAPRNLSTGPIAFTVADQNLKIRAHVGPRQYIAVMTRVCHIESACPEALRHPCQISVFSYAPDLIIQRLIGKSVSKAVVLSVHVSKMDVLALPLQQA